MSRTTPVRWWRDDATRYRSRPPYVAPELDVPQWVFDLPPPDPALVAMFAWLDRDRDRYLLSLALPSALLGGDGVGAGR